MIIPTWLHVLFFFPLFNRGLSSVVEQLTPDQPVSGSIPLVLTFFNCSHTPSDDWRYSLIYKIYKTPHFDFIPTPTLRYSYLPTQDIYPFLSTFLRAPIAQSVEHGANNARVVGSSPTGSIFYSAWERRQEEARQDKTRRDKTHHIMFLFSSLYLTGDLAQW